MTKIRKADLAEVGVHNAYDVMIRAPRGIMVAYSGPVSGRGSQPASWHVTVVGNRTYGRRAKAPRDTPDIRALDAYIAKFPHAWRQHLYGYWDFMMHSPSDPVQFADARDKAIMLACELFGVDADDFVQFPIAGFGGKKAPYVLRSDWDAVEPVLRGLIAEGPQERTTLEDIEVQMRADALRRSPVVKQGVKHSLFGRPAEGAQLDDLDTVVVYVTKHASMGNDVIVIESRSGTITMNVKAGPALLDALAKSLRESVETGD